MTRIEPDDTDLRTQAIRHLKKRRDFAAHVLVYVLVNSSVVVIWAVSSSGGFFWPIFLIMFWGIGLVMNAWDIWHEEPFSESQIAREVARQRTKR